MFGKYLTLLVQNSMICDMRDGKATIVPRYDLALHLRGKI